MLARQALYILILTALFCVEYIQDRLSQTICLGLGLQAGATGAWPHVIFFLKELLYECGRTIMYSCIKMEK
jgi:hypothetical protein